MANIDEKVQNLNENGFFKTPMGNSKSLYNI